MMMISRLWVIIISLKLVITGHSGLVCHMMKLFFRHESEPQAKWHWSYGNVERRLPKVTRWNYVFDKWVYKDKDGVEREFTGTTILTDEMTVYAKWNPGKCDVFYDATGGEIPDSECNRVGLKSKQYYQVTTESTLAKDGKQIPVPVSPRT